MKTHPSLLDDHSDFVNRNGITWCRRFVINFSLLTTTDKESAKNPDFKILWKETSLLSLQLLRLHASDTDSFSHLLSLMVLCNQTNKLANCLEIL